MSAAPSWPERTKASLVGSAAADAAMAVGAAAGRDCASVVAATHPTRHAVRPPRPFAPAASLCR